MFFKCCAAVALHYLGVQPKHYCIWYFVESMFFVMSVFPPLGIHYGCILSADLGWSEVDVRGSSGDTETQQSDGDQGLDTGHFLQERQAVGRPQHDRAQQALPHHEERHHPLHHEVKSKPLNCASILPTACCFASNSITFKNVGLWLRCRHFTYYTFPYFCIFFNLFFFLLEKMTDCVCYKVIKGI